MQWAFKSFGVSGLNPKVFLLFLALLPQFAVPAAAWPVSTQMIALGLVHVANCGVVYTLVSLGSKSVLRARPKGARVISQVSGVAMVAIALLLLVERFSA
jgi:threonine/homoserine/homoserine lactone efflux protein